MKSAAAVRDDELYSADTTPPPTGEADPYNAPTRVGYLPGAVTEADVAAALAPAPLGAFASFFPPDDTSREITPRKISGEYEKVVFETAGKKLEFEPQIDDESLEQELKPIALPAAPVVLQQQNVEIVEKAPVVRLQEDTIMIPRPRSAWLDFAWMMGLAFVTASTVFVGLWLAAGR